MIRKSLLLFLLLTSSVLAQPRGTISQLPDPMETPPADPTKVWFVVDDMNTGKKYARRVALDRLNSFLDIPESGPTGPTFDTVAAMSASSGHASGTIAFCKNYANLGDDGGGFFWLDASGTPGPNPEGAPNGLYFDAIGGTDWYWRRILPGNFVTPQMYGAAGDGVDSPRGGTDDTAECSAALENVGDYDVYFPPDRKYLVNGGLELSRDETRVFGGAFILLKDNATTVEGFGVLRVSGDRNIVEGLTIKGNKGAPPSATVAPTMYVDGDENRITKVQLYDADTTGGTVSFQNNLQVEGERNVIEGVGSFNPEYGGFFDNGNDNQYINCKMRAGPDNNAEKGWFQAGGASKDGKYVHIDGFDSDTTLQIDWASHNSPKVVERAYLANCHVVTSGTACKLAHIRYAHINGCHFESTAGDGLVFAERLFDVHASNSTFIGFFPSGQHVRGFPAGNKHRTINNLTIDNCTIGPTKRDPTTGLESFAIEVPCYKFTLRDSVVRGFITAAVACWPDTTGVTEITNNPPTRTGSENIYLIGPSPTGVWVGHAHGLAWDKAGASDWLYEDLANGELTFGTRVYDEDTNTWYRFLNATDGWEEVPLEEFGIHVSNTKFVGYRAPGADVHAMGGASSAMIARLKSTSQIQFYNNQIINLHPSGTTEVSNSILHQPLFRMVGPGVWYTVDGNPPDQGLWSKGDLIKNPNAELGETLWWVCTTGGNAASTAVFTPLAFGDFITPEMHGAAADGSTNDTVAIQAALDDPNFEIVLMDGNYRATGLSMTDDGTTVMGSGTIKLIDSSSDTELLAIDADNCTVRGLELSGNIASPPSVSTGSALVVNGDFNHVIDVTLRDAANPVSDTNQDNIRVMGDNNVIERCRSFDAEYALYRNAGSGNQFVNCFGRGSTNTRKGFSSTGPGGTMGTSLLLDGLDLDGVLQCDWAAGNDPAVMGVITIRGCRVVSTDSDSPTAIKLAHTDRAVVTDSYFETQVNGGEALVLAERIRELVLRDSTFIAALNSTGAPIDSFPAAGSICQTMHRVLMDGCTVGNIATDPADADYVIAIDFRACDVVVTNTLVHGFATVGIRPWRSDDGGVEEIGLDTPPSLTGSDNVWVVGNSPTGAWAGKARALAWDSSVAGDWVFEEEGVAEPNLLRPGTRVFDKDTTSWYEYRNSTDGWVELEDDKYGLRLENDTFIGHSAGNVFAVGATLTEQLNRSDQIIYVGNTLENRGAGGSQEAASGSIQPLFQMTAPGLWYGSSAPSQAVWGVGDYVRNPGAAPRESKGWICTTGGDASTTAVFTPLDSLPLAGSTTWDPPNLFADTGTSTTFTVTGAEVGDFVEVAIPLDLQNLRLTAWVSASDTVKLELWNHDTPVNLDSATWKVKVTE